MTTIDRRGFLRSTLRAAGAGAVLAAGTTLSQPGLARAQTGLYGPLDGRPADSLGLILPEGFRSRLIARGGEQVEGTSYAWHPFPDGGGCFSAPDGGWVYVSNSEVWVRGRGGASAVRFDAAGRIVDAYPILSGTLGNCAGGATPWDTWLSSEEWDGGRVWECDPFGRSPAVVRPAMGTFGHEGAAVDAEGRAVYMTEDRPDGLLYRFRPERWPDLASGTLEAAAVGTDGRIERWLPVPDPEAQQRPVRQGVPGATRFNGAEGVCIFGSTLYFSTKGDAIVRSLDLRTGQLTVIWDGREPLSGADNLTTDPLTGDLYACEDGGNMELAVFGPDGQPAPFARFVGHERSEVAGAAFSPDRTRLYVSSQRGPTPKRLRDLIPEATDAPFLGVTVEISGPFRNPGVPPAVVPRAPEGAGTAVGRPGTVVAGAAAVAGLGALLALRRRAARQQAGPHSVD